MSSRITFGVPQDLDITDNPIFNSVTVNSISAGNLYPENWQSVYTTVSSNSGSWGLGGPLLDMPYLPLSGGTITGNLQVSGTTTLSSDVTIGTEENYATLFVEQNRVGINTEDPAEALTVMGNAALHGDVLMGMETLPTTLFVQSEFVGINTENPTDALTVAGNIRSTGTIYALEGNSIQWSEAHDALSSLNMLNQLSALNQLTAVYVLNPVTAVEVTNPVTAVNILNSVAIKDLNDNNVSVVPATSSLNVNVTNSIVATVDPLVGFPITFANTPNVDAFGRLRISQPLTIFDSSHRYHDNNLWSSLTANGGSVFFNSNQGLIEMSVNNLSGSSVIRETTKVFSYQPGKSMEVLTTFVMAPSAVNLRQRVGYFGQTNGIYLQLDDGQISFVKRSLVNGLPVTETIVPLSAWNGDKLNGTGPSGLTLDITKAQILWMDIEWLGLGTVRIGFVINGQFIVCHSFHHANKIDSTYITTASLPLRQEITNKNATNGSRVMKQVCSTVISEGGYELRGLQQAIGTPIQTPKVLAVAGTFYPIISLRLKTSPDRLDAIVILTALSIMGIGNGINYNWQIKASGVTSGGSWISADNISAVEYNITGTGFSSGRTVAAGFLNSSNQGSPTTNLLKDALFKFQLERNGLTQMPYELTLVVASDTNAQEIFASVDWEEVSR